jgi:23S rRNA (adenine2030-N6)-methyltransferase
MALDFPDSLMDLYRGNRCRIELRFSEMSSEEKGMYGCGLIVYNPPWTLKSILEHDMPELSNLLEGTFSLDWKE